MRMTPAAATGRKGPVSYYACVNGIKRGIENCPVKRINAEALHEVVLAEIERCAAHPSRIQLLCRAAAQLLPAPEDLREQRRRLRTKLNQKEREMESVTVAIGHAPVAALKALTNRLGELGIQKERLERELRDTESSLETALRQRPNAEQVAGIWGKVLELWRKATGEERQEILSLLVDRVSLKGRNSEGDKKIEGELRLILATPLRQVREFALLSSRKLSKSEPVYPKVVTVTVELPSARSLRGVL